MKTLYLVIYYTLAVHLPTPPFPGYQLANAVRRFLVKRVVEYCGDDVMVNSNCNFGRGVGLRIGYRSRLGTNGHIDHYVTIGDNVLMGPDVVIMTQAAAFEDPDIPIRDQGRQPIRPVCIGNDVWLGTRAVILPGVHIGDHAIVGANSVVTHDVPPKAVVGGNPARIIRMRGDKLTRAPDARADLLATWN